MKPLKIHLRIIALFFSSLIFFQGCTVYKSANVSLEEASKSEAKVKVKTIDNQTLKFNRIAVEDGNYFGVKKNKGEMIKTLIEEDEIEKVQLKNKITSIILPIGIVIVSAVVIIWGGASGFD